MDKDADSDPIRSAQACAWCDQRLAPHECEGGKRVCDRCIRLLRDAGLTEGEIYGSDTDSDDDN